MAPTENIIEAAIRQTVQNIFYSKEREDLSVNTARSRTEVDVHLTEGFLKTGEWKDKSKAIIKAETERLLELEEAGAGEPSSRPPAKSDLEVKKTDKEVVKKGRKRTSDNARIQPTKRQKKDLTLISEEENTLTVAEHAFGVSRDIDSSQPPKSRKRSKGTPKKASTRGKGSAELCEENIKETGTIVEAIVKKTNSRSRKIATLGKKAVEENEEDDTTKSDQTSDIKEQDKEVAETQIVAESESELSVVLDEPPVPKNRAMKADLKTKSTSSKRAKVSNDLTADEIEVKHLQSQLQKCGIRKVWGVELKKYGDDMKAKIRHLRQMLRDVGMEGRFSEARAAEIREMRELQADLQAVQEGDLKWGMGRGSRSSKNKKSMAVDIPSEEENEDNNGQRESRSASSKVRKEPPRAKLDLEFLGDESDSD